MISTTPVAHFFSASAPELRTQAERFSHSLITGEVIILKGQLGVGKTTFTQGLARGLGITELISSPTFTLSRLYLPQRNQIGLLHLDVYRLLESAPDKNDNAAWYDYFGYQLESLDVEEYLRDCVIVMEWGQGLAEIFVNSWLEITITAFKEGVREILIERVTI